MKVADFYKELNTIVSEMNMFGLKIDAKLLDTMIAEQEKTATETAKEIEDGLVVAGFAKINYNSSRELGKLLFEDMGMEPVKYTTTGKPSVDKFTLEVLAKQNPLVAGIERLKSAQKKHKMLVNIKTAMDMSGRIYPQLHVNGAVSGRFTMDGGLAKVNPQQWPKEFRVLVLPD